MSNKRMAGVTLVELIIAIAIVGMALAGLAAVYNRANIASADPVIQQQMIAIGETMMEEIMLKPFAQSANQAGRANYNDVQDYAGYASSGIRDATDNAVPSLQDYGVSVAVSPAALAGIAANGDALRIDVTVSYRGQSLTLTGWRTRPST